MTKWIRKIFFTDMNSQIDDINNQIKDFRVEMRALTFIVQKQSELIAALATVQADIIHTLGYEQNYLQSNYEDAILQKIIMPMPDDDDLLN